MANIDWPVVSTTWAPRALGVLRIVSAYLFLLHGSAKLLGFPPTSMPSPPLLSLSGVAGMMELVGGALLIVGLLSRPVAFLLSGEMAVAYFMAHASKGSPLFPLANGGDAAVLYCFVFLYIFFAGPGAWSLDAARGRARPS